MASVYVLSPSVLRLRGRFFSREDLRFVTGFSPLWYTIAPSEPATFFVHSGMFFFFFLVPAPAYLAFHHSFFSDVS